MNINIKRKSIILAILFWAASMAPLSMEAMFLSRDSVPQGGAMAGAMTALGEDVMGFYYNPASLGSIHLNEIYASYGPRFLGIDSSVDLYSGNAGGVFKLTDRFGIGLGMMTFRASGLYSEGEIIMRGGYELNRHFSIGGGIRTIWLSYAEDDYTPLNETFDGGLGTTEISFDLGVRYRKDNFLLGIRATDINSPDMGLKNSDLLPMSLNVGAGYIHDMDTRLGLEIGLRGSDYDVSLGVERYLNNFAFRGGIGIGSRDYLEATAGFGHDWNDITIDYSFSYPLSGLTNHYGNHEVGLGYRFGKSRRAEQIEIRHYYADAVERFESGKYKEAARYAQEAFKNGERLDSSQREMLDKINTIGSYIDTHQMGDENVQRCLQQGIEDYMSGDLRSGLMNFAYAYSRTDHSGLRRLIRVLERESETDLEDEGIVLSWNLADQYTNKGMDRIRAHEFEAAIREFERALRFEPDNIDALKPMGTAYYMLGRTSQARKVWERVLELDPEDESVRKMLDQL